MPQDPMEICMFAAIYSGKMVIWCFGFAVPAATRQLPEDYVERVKRVHESGGYGSKGYVL